ncbi:MAG: HIT family hydrolase [Planctomyces sp.]|nr:HIT family hydrolase [Planctomyces sp.]MBA4119662.1 HIT family hydrolase [Isosphaera sp.]
MPDARPPTPPPSTAPAGPIPVTANPPAAPDAMLQAPWRQSYLEGIAAEPEHAGPGPGGAARPAGEDGEAAASFLALAWKDPAGDDQNLVVCRDAHGMVLLNRYPYTGGHLLVALGEGRPRLIDYDPAQRAALWSLVDRAAAISHRAIQPHGLNIGLNQGRAAGATLPQHLHVHVVPRWSGDVNFIAVVGKVRVIPAALEVMLARCRGAWEAVRSGWE